nr:MAG: hypothetical protein [brine shrimp tombus-like virus 1]
MEQTSSRVSLRGNPKPGASLGTDTPREKAGGSTSHKQAPPDGGGHRDKPAGYGRGGPKRKPRSNKIPPNKGEGGQQPGNAKRKGAQQTLASKHRWSKEDVRSAPNALLRSRVLHLQSMVEELRKTINSTSRGRSEGAIAPIKKAKPSGKAGSVGQIPLARSLPPSTRKTVSLPLGMNGEPAPTATLRPSQKDNETPSCSPDGERKQPRSTVSSVTISAPEKTPTSNRFKPLEVEVTRHEPITLRGLPPVGGASYAETLRLGAKASSDPKYVPVMSPKHTGRPERSEVRAVRGADALVVEDELTDYLHYKFLLEDRTNKTPAKMKKEADNYLRRYDTSNITWGNLVHIVSRAIQAAMVPTSDAVLLRNFFKDDSLLNEMKKQTKFANEGALGKAGLLGKKFFLPKSA